MLASLVEAGIDVSLATGWTAGVRFPKGARDFSLFHSAFPGGNAAGGRSRPLTI
jgi:hypothetical protein